MERFIFFLNAMYKDTDLPNKQTTSTIVPSAAAFCWFPFFLLSRRWSRWFTTDIYRNFHLVKLGNFWKQFQRLFETSVRRQILQRRLCPLRIHSAWWLMRDFSITPKYNSKLSFDSSSSRANTEAKANNNRERYKVKMKLYVFDRNKPNSDSTSEHQATEQRHATVLKTDKNKKVPAADVLTHFRGWMTTIDHGLKWKRTMTGTQADCLGVDHCWCHHVWIADRGRTRWAVAVSINVLCIFLNGPSELLSRFNEHRVALRRIETFSRF